MGIASERISVTTTGADAAATGSDTSTYALVGWLQDIYLDYHASAPATTDVTISFATRGGNILVVTNNATDGRYPVRDTPYFSDGSLMTDALVEVCLNDKITISVAGCNALTGAVVAYIQYRT